uniref:Conjugal transfer protein TrbG n=1 Tax=Biomphalaria glabrata TaxID=6526 RepID=A0A2C9LGC5_BIOGL
MSNADLAYELRFLYAENSNPSMNYATTIIPDITDNNNDLNFNYSISGSDKIAPIMAFDDGEFTYLKFRTINVEMPAIFDVDARGNESIINYKSVDDYIVIERVSSLFTLRAGNEITCLFNENIPFIKEEVRKRKK